MSERTLRVQRLDSFTLESGVVLREVRQAYHLDGALNAARDNLVIVFHALTGGPDAAGDWWRELVGPGGAIDTDRYAVLCPNLLGSCYGTTGPWEADRRPFPAITPRDQARLVHTLVAELGAASVALAVGGSLGGMIALEWVATYPELTRSTVVLAAPAAHTAAGIAWNHVQRRVIQAAGEAEGLEIARAVAMLTYRTGEELGGRFGREPHHDGGFLVERYLDRHGVKLRGRFDPHSYLALLGAMDAHDVGRGRGGVERALRPVAGRLIGVGIPGDLLYPEREVRRWVQIACGEYWEINSTRGHDAFLLETRQVAEILEDALAESTAAVTTGSR